MVPHQSGSRPTRRALLRTGLAATAFGARSFAPVAARQPPPGSVGYAATLKETGGMVTASPVATAPAWPIGQGGNAARTRNMPGPAPQGQPKVRWTFPGPDAKPAGAIADYPMVADGVLYVESALGYLAIDTTTGKELWRSSAGVGGAIAGDGIILRSAKPNAAGYDLIRISRKDGSVVWTAEQEKILSDNWTPDVADGVGYMPSGSDLLAFDPATGKTRWRTALQAPASRGAAVANGLAYVTIFGGPASAYLALDLATGKERWHATTDVNAHFSNGAINATTV